MLSDAQRAMVAARLRKGRGTAAGGIPRRTPGGAVPLSFGQEQLWFIDQFAPGLATYNVAGAIRLRGDLDAAALGRALDGLRERHEALRTRLVNGPDGQPTQVVDNPVPVSLPVEEVSEERLRELAVAEGSQPFSLADGPLSRARLFRTGADEHLLVIVVHHAVFDGWSFGVLLRELSALYEAEVSGVSAPLPPLPIQFADYAVWERDRLQGETLAGLVKYWREELDGAQTLELPTDRPRPLLESHRGDVVTLPMDTRLLDGLRELSRQQGTTLFVVLLAALQVLLHRYSGQDDIVVGTPSANRSRAELAPLIGYLVNTLPIRARMSGDPTFVELLDQVRQTTVAASAHQDLPFAKLISALNVPRDPSRTPVFQVSFSNAEGGEHSVSAAGVEMEVTADYAEPDTAKFDLTFFVGCTAEEFVAVGQYATDVFDESTVRRMLGHFAVLLGGIVADPGRRLSALPLLSARDLHRETVEWNDTAVDFPVVCLHERFESQAAATPDVVAAVLGNESITYAELNARANRIARWLRDKGAGPEVLIGVCLPPSIRRLAVVLGILKAGSGYVPLDPALPLERLSYMVGDARMPVVVTDSAGPSSLGDADVVSVDEADISGLSETNLEVAVEPSNLAYVIYTSGSTGQPKGVMVEHRQAINFVLGQVGHWPVLPGDRVLQFASLNFDASVQDMFVSLLSGATAVLGTRETLLSPPRLTKLLRGNRVSVACLPPAVANLIADEQFPDLRVLMIAGEELPTTLMRRWLRPGLRLCNGYGPTETTVTPMFAELDGTIEPPPIGRPAPNYVAYVLDATLTPVPVEVIGELHVGGAGVTRGYLNRPELTALRFIDDPFRPGGRLYKTGDLVRRRPDGLIQFVGRVDDQVKLRGLRVEVGEIEAALTSHPGVAQAVVIMTPDAGGDKQLVGYVRLDSPAGSGELRRHIARWLPDYMVPAHIVVVDAFPLNASGKIHKAALPRPGVADPVATYQAPTTLTETVLVELYRALLNRERVGVDDGFFDLSGNSLQAMQLVTRIRNDLGVDIGVTAVFLAPTPRRLAARIEAIRAGTARPASSGLVVELSDGGEPFFLVHAVGGTVYAYAPLARELPFAVYGIEAAGLTEGVPASSLAGMVERYAKEIRAVRPGPYRLGGWSMGGVVAYELARHLESLGEEVSLVALLDPPFSLPPTTLAEFASEFVADAARTLGWTSASAAWESDPLGWLARKLSSGAADVDAVRAAIERRFEVFGAHRRLMAGYRPQAGVAADLVLVHATASPNLAGQPLWLEILGPVLATAVDGDHYTFLQPPRVRVVAELIAAAQSGVSLTAAASVRPHV
ncbi:amino acid adenylation domain-containing protein [Actinophytocola sp.]|uniref:non-ribosomal peptide synthetase n=1 Tax=Actinophytocola sp. TaxID=1872138 RepID=UPI002ED1AC92